MKSYTDLEQSKKLAEVLPIESADMYYMEISCNNYTIGVLQRLEKDMLLKQAEYYKMFPCWSLSALINVLPNGIVINKDAGNGKYHVSSTHIGTYIKEDNPVDACVTMIEKLHELKML